MAELADGEEVVPPDVLARISEENERLKQEVLILKERHEKEKQRLEMQVRGERSIAEREAEANRDKTTDLEKMKMQMVMLTRKLDDEVSAKDQVVGETHRLERKLQELSMGSAAGGTAASGSAGGSGEEERSREKTSQVSTKLMRVVDQWMRCKDIQQALLRDAAINDLAFATLAQALVDCPSLQTLDLSRNLLTMDSCSDLCQLITTAPCLSFISLAENLLSLRCVGYFMTAIMERQTTKRLVPLDLLDLQGNEGLQMALAHAPPQELVSKLRDAAQTPAGKGLTSPPAIDLASHVMRSLWRFLHDTQHPQVKNTTVDEYSFDSMDKVTLNKMDNALMKILLLAADETFGKEAKAVTANVVLLPAMLVQAQLVRPDTTGSQTAGTRRHSSQESSPAAAPDKAKLKRQPSKKFQKAPEPPAEDPKVSDPFADLKSAFEPVKEKAKSFNRKQIVSRTGTVLMNMLERLLETTDIDAVDVTDNSTLLEYACTTGNMGLAKLCYRRGAKLMAKTRRGDTAFNIVTRAKRYDMMEFLHIYGVKINSADAEGRTALHVAAQQNDVDGICRLIEWGADVNITDNKKRTPIHVAAAGGNFQACMLLLEMGADMNAKDIREYTARELIFFMCYGTIWDSMPRCQRMAKDALASRLLSLNACSRN
ncbi:unnamed protein product [Symbiodinium natans]|uniref:Uncharacterized protein n=1 Tax=Symbiodinium natans TaxID=878477 RepID=A0A812SWP0_9DINO|nr:unnamed protein product [Symbiodinium natans]